jgi:hypothetical protein
MEAITVIIIFHKNPCLNNNHFNLKIIIKINQIILKKNFLDLIQIKIISIITIIKLKNKILIISIFLMATLIIMNPARTRFLIKIKICLNIIILIIKKTPISLKSINWSAVKPLVNKKPNIQIIMMKMDKAKILNLMKWSPIIKPIIFQLNKTDQTVEMK